MKLVDLPLAAINPFDGSHVRLNMPPGFSAFDKVPGEHLDGARHCADLLARGVPVRPIAVCRSDLVPAGQRRTDRAWQRLDGFKRYWGHVIAGRETITCVVLDEYLPGAQDGQSMEMA